MRGRVRSRLDWEMRGVTHHELGELGEMRGNENREPPLVVLPTEAL